MRNASPLVAVAAGLMALCGCELFRPAHSHTDEHTHTDEEAHGPDDSELVVTTVPTAIEAGADTTITLQLLDPEGEPATGIDIVHERYVHVMLSSQDLHRFAHIHHEDFWDVTSADLDEATFRVNYSFPTAGTYLLHAGWCRDGNAGESLHTFTVGGTPPQEAQDDDPSRVVVVDGYRVTLAFPAGDPAAGVETDMMFTVELEDGTPVSDLELYLGEGMHGAFVADDLGRVIHIHPHREDTPHAHCGPLLPQVHFGPDVPFKVRLASGRYKLWGQFQHLGVPHFAGFVVDVP